VDLAITVRHLHFQTQVPGANTFSLNAVFAMKTYSNMWVGFLQALGRRLGKAVVHPRRLPPYCTLGVNSYLLGLSKAAGQCNSAVVVGLV
jgi:hypothetical protein